MYMWKTVSFVGVLVLATVGIVDGIIGIPDLSVTVERGKVAKSLESDDVETFVIRNKKGLEVSICTLGATITHLSVPDRSGKVEDVVLGYDTPSEYQTGSSYFGAIVGRVANRIANGRFVLDGKEYTLAKNDGGVNTLHGGTKGFDKRIWDAKVIRSGVEFTLRSADGDEGFPGAVVVTARYVLKDRTLSVEMSARADAPTPINLAQHSYFNLAGHASGSILGHEVQLSADAYTELKQSVCTGSILACASTPLDFSQPAVVGESMVRLARAQGIALEFDAGERRMLVPPNRTAMTPADEGGPESGVVLGFDHNFVLRKAGGWLARLPLLRGLLLAPVARVREPRSGRTLTVASDAPGVQFYTGNFLNRCNGKGGALYQQHGGLCLETQHFPNSIGADPATPFGAGACPVLRPNALYRHRVRYTFGVDS